MKQLFLAVLVTSACAGEGAGHVSMRNAAPAVKVARFGGCPVFTARGYYNANVSAAALDPYSARYIKSLVSGGDNSSGFYASIGYEYVNVANNATPLLTIRQSVPYHTFAVPYPWRAAFRIEPLSDRHSIVLQTQTCRLYEAYGAEYNAETNVLLATSGANWDLTKAFVPLPAGNPSAMASGLPIFAGMVKWEEYQAGPIRHALNWAPYGNADLGKGSAAQYQFVTPASDTDGLAYGGTVTPAIPYGAHLRLRASFDTTGFGPQALAVVKAMQAYGIYLADSGSDPNALYFANKLDGSNPWSSSDLGSLGKVHITDFDVLRLPPVQTVPGR